MSRLEERFRPAWMTAQTMTGLWQSSLHILGRLFCIGLVLILVAAVAASRTILPPENAKLAAASIIHITPGASGSDIAELLSQEGIIRSKAAFNAAIRLMGLEQSLKAGDYQLSPGMDLLKDTSGGRTSGYVRGHNPEG